MIKHLISSGCSFTSDGTGGLPPSLDRPTGGCSFVNGDTVTTPKSWVGYVAQQLQVSSLVNLAASSYGNILIANTVMTLLNNYHYNPATTLILFNLSDPGRLDTPCDWKHVDRCDHCDWSADIIPYTYIKRNSPTDMLMLKNIGIDQVESMSSNAVLGMMALLEHYKFNFKFLLMSDYQSHPQLGPVIEKFQSHMIKLNPGVGMKEFVQELHLNTGDQFHPDTVGHQQIAQLVMQQL
jgi:hypothetical protein